ncbi:MAG TPA: hypothetical protein VM532_13035 [Burkholderiales bacterium]|nr:hypothetical protein [Burkholderiales bacterium]
MIKLNQLFVATLAAVSIHAFACDVEDDPDQLPRKLSISVTSLNYAQTDEHNIVTTIGAIKNSSSSCAQELVVEVKYFDGQGKQVDVVTQLLYGIVVPPHDEVAFRVRDEADKPKDLYVKSTARIVAAEPKFSAKPRREKSMLIEMLVSWGPMLLLISVWAFFMRKYSGEKSPQRRSLALIEKQTGMLMQQVQALERLANAAEQRNIKNQ